MSLGALLKEVRACKFCEKELPLGPNPILRADEKAQILIVGQAPGTRVHETGIPWNDPSGDRLRQWMNVDPDLFYNEKKFAIIPMGYCYPGRGKSGDLPPRKECAELWLDKLLTELPNIKFTILIGQYAQDHYLGDARKSTLTETVKAWEEYFPKYLPLPHPSPRNNIWLRKNPWFEEDVLPVLKKSVKELI